MDAKINVSHQLRVLLPNSGTKQMNTDTCNKPSTSFYRKYIVHQMIVSNHCIVLKMLYDMSNLTCFLKYVK